MDLFFEQYFRNMQSQKKTESDPIASMNLDDVEIIYEEEAAPMPWMMRSSMYGKDLPAPELSDAGSSAGSSPSPRPQRIGSVLVPSPLLRLKSPLSDFSKDPGRLSSSPLADSVEKLERSPSPAGIIYATSPSVSLSKLPAPADSPIIVDASAKSPTISLSQLPPLPPSPANSPTARLHEFLELENRINKANPVDDSPISGLGVLYGSRISPSPSQERMSRTLWDLADTSIEDEWVLSDATSVGTKVHENAEILEQIAKTDYIRDNEPEAAPGTESLFTPGVGGSRTSVLSKRVSAANFDESVPRFVPLFVPINESETEKDTPIFVESVGEAENTNANVPNDDEEKGVNQNRESISGSNVSTYSYSNEALNSTGDEPVSRRQSIKELIQTFEEGKASNQQQDSDRRNAAIAGVTVAAGILYTTSSKSNEKSTQATQQPKDLVSSDLQDDGKEEQKRIESAIDSENLPLNSTVETESFSLNSAMESENLQSTNNKISQIALDSNEVESIVAVESAEECLQEVSAGESKLKDIGMIVNGHCQADDSIHEKDSHEALKENFGSIKGNGAALASVAAVGLLAARFESENVTVETDGRKNRILELLQEVAELVKEEQNLLDNVLKENNELRKQLEDKK